MRAAWTHRPVLLYDLHGTPPPPHTHTHKPVPSYEEYPKLKELIVRKDRQVCGWAGVGWMWGGRV